MELIANDPPRAMAIPVLPVPTETPPPTELAIISLLSVALSDTPAFPATMLSVTTELPVIPAAIVLWTLFTEPASAPARAPPNLFLLDPTETDPAMVKAQILESASAVRATAPTGSSSVPIVEPDM